MKWTIRQPPTPRGIVCTPMCFILITIYSFPYQPEGSTFPDVCYNVFISFELSLMDASLNKLLGFELYVNPMRFYVDFLWFVTFSPPGFLRFIHVSLYVCYWSIILLNEYSISCFLILLLMNIGLFPFFHYCKWYCSEHFRNVIIWKWMHFCGICLLE